MYIYIYIYICFSTDRPCIPSLMCPNSFSYSIDAFVHSLVHIHETSQEMLGSPHNHQPPGISWSLLNAAEILINRGSEIPNRADE